MASCVSKDILVKAVEEGLTLKQLCERFNCRIWTIRRWLAQFNLKTKSRYHGTRTAKYEMGHCKYHGVTTFVYETYRKGYRCRTCRAGKHTEKRRELKSLLVEITGGKCVRCGYNKCLWALQFDHRDPEAKQYNVSNLVAQLKKSVALEEIKKCDLLCANCHAEKTSIDMGW